MDWKSIISGVIGSLLSVAVLYLIGLLGETPALLVPANTIIAFDGETCPDGWDLFSAGAGRVVLGADDKIFMVRDKGGNPEQTITIKNMPPHSHREELSGGVGPNIGYAHVTGQSWGFNNNVGVEHRTDIEGEGKPFSIMPPWIALKYCKKR